MSGSREVPALHSGQLVCGRYRVDAKIGEGGMAEVYRVRDEEKDELVALKLLRPSIASRRGAVERIRREGDVLRALSNPAIVGSADSGELDDGSVFLIMELLEGESLGDLMKRGSIDPVKLAPIVTGTCAGLHAAHVRGIVHRDLKPDNIFLCPSEFGVQVKLLDFGISKVYGSNKLTQTGEILGTPRYMSPEQLTSEGDIDGRTDIYALGVILYEAISGHPPFLATTPTDLIVSILHGEVPALKAAHPDVDSAVEAVVMRAMSRPRIARFDSAPKLADAYVDAVGGVGVVRQATSIPKATMMHGAFAVGEEQDAIPDTRPPPPSAAAIKAGTFSGLGKLAPPPAAPAHLPASLQPAPTVPATAVMDMSEVSLPSIESPSAPTKSPTREHTAAPSLPREPAKAPRSGVAARIAVVIGALAAGALSAALVILALRHFTRAGEGADSAVSSGMVASQDASSTTGRLDAGGAEAEASLTPTGVDIPDSPPEPDAGPPARASARTRRGRRSPPGGRLIPPSDNGSTGNENGAPTSERSIADYLREARAARRAGNPRRCVALLNDAIQRGAPAIALANRAQCYEAAAERESAIRDYRRFCRLVPDHPAIPQARQQLAEWGQSCP